MLEQAEPGLVQLANYWVFLNLNLNKYSSMTNIMITLASVPDRDSLVAELWCGDTQLAELFQDGEKFLLEFYAPPHGTLLQLPYDDVLQALILAKQRLTVEVE